MDRPGNFFTLVDLATLPPQLNYLVSAPAAINGAPPPPPPHPANGPQGLPQPQQQLQHPAQPPQRPVQPPQHPVQPPQHLVQPPQQQMQQQPQPPLQQQQGLMARQPPQQQQLQVQPQPPQQQAQQMQQQQHQPQLQQQQALIAQQQQQYRQAQQLNHGLQVAGRPSPSLAVMTETLNELHEYAIRNSIGFQLIVDKLKITALMIGAGPLRTPQDLNLHLVARNTVGLIPPAAALATGPNHGVAAQGVAHPPPSLPPAIPPHMKKSNTGTQQQLTNSPAARPSPKAAPDGPSSSSTARGIALVDPARVLKTRNPIVRGAGTMPVKTSAAASAAKPQPIADSPASPPMTRDARGSAGVEEAPEEGNENTNNRRVTRGTKRAFSPEL